MRESERLESAVQACAVSLTNTRFPHHGNSPYPILAGTQVHVVKDNLTTEMHNSDIRRERINTDTVCSSDIKADRI